MHTWNVLTISLSWQRRFGGMTPLAFTRWLTQLPKESSPSSHSLLTLCDMTLSKYVSQLKARMSYRTKKIKLRFTGWDEAGSVKKQRLQLRVWCALKFSIDEALPISSDNVGTSKACWLRLVLHLCWWVLKVSPRSLDQVGTTMVTSRGNSRRKCAF